MSRRSDTPIPQFAKQEKSSTNLPIKEQEYAKQTSISNANEYARQTSISNANAAIKEKPYTTEEALKLYHGSAKGYCPLCGKKMKHNRGITGHLSKCLRIWNFKHESPTTT